jgi:hypothetical protein
MRSIHSILLFLCLLTACGAPSSDNQATVSGLAATAAPSTQVEAPEPTVTLTPTPVTPEAAATPIAEYTDPWAYCAAVENIDVPDDRYAGDRIPESIVLGYHQTADGQGDIPEWLPRTMFWRCMEGKVYACSVGANLPCDEKANTSQEPTEAAKEFCRNNPNGPGVRDKTTIYNWTCVDGAPKRGEQWTEADAAGFLADIWYEIERP